MRARTIPAAAGWVQGGMPALFAAAGLLLMALAAREGWQAALAGLDAEAAQGLIQAVGLLAAAAVAMQTAHSLAQEARVRTPAPVRRWLARFFVALVVAIVVEGLVATFRALHDDLAQLAYASVLMVAAGGLLVGWGVFLRAHMAPAARGDGQPR